MTVQRWSEDVILVNLPKETGRQDGLQSVIALLREHGACDVVVDFSQVQKVTGDWLTHLEHIRKLANQGEHKLTLCGIAPSMRRIFAIARLDHVFDFAEDRFAALAKHRMVMRPTDLRPAETRARPSRLLAMAGKTGIAS
ncbi:MAG: STAS domain-containing protein [Solirubrobacterales bacterium]